MQKGKRRNKKKSPSRLQRKGVKGMELEESSAEGMLREHLENWKDSGKGISEGTKTKSSGAGAWPELLKGLTKKS